MVLYKELYKNQKIIKEGVIILNDNCKHSPKFRKKLKSINKSS